MHPTSEGAFGAPRIVRHISGNGKIPPEAESAGNGAEKENRTERIGEISGMRKVARRSPKMECVTRCEKEGKGVEHICARVWPYPGLL